LEERRFLVGRTTRGEFFERLVEIKVRHNDKTIEDF